MYRLRLAWWRLQRSLRALLVPRREIVRWEGLAEAAYDKMYDVKYYYEARERYDEAFQCLQEAIKIARAQNGRGSGSANGTPRSHLQCVLPPIQVITPLVAGTGDHPRGVRMLPDS
jgi:tetratricopeptide (TPR) repeat protein